MPPRIPNPKLTVPKLSVPKLGRAKATTPSSDEAQTTELAPERTEAPAVEAPATVPAPAKRGRGRLTAPKLSAPKLAMPKLGARKAGNASMTLSRGRPERDVVGLDIEPGYVVAAQASVNGSVRVVRAVGAPLDLEVVRDGEVLDPQALGSALAELFRGSGLGRTVRVGLANQRTVLRTLDLPPIEDRKELAAAVRFQAEEEVPMPLNNAVLDFQPLGLVDTSQGKRQRVVLVAAQRDMVERLLQALQIAGLRPVGVDLSAFAMIRSLYRRDGQRGPNLVYLGVGGLTNMAVADGITCKFTRVLGGGLESMAESLAARREIPVTAARELLFSVGLPEDEVAADVSTAIPSAPGGDAAYGADATSPYADAPEAYADYEAGYEDEPTAAADTGQEPAAAPPAADQDYEPVAEESYDAEQPKDDYDEAEEVQFHTYSGEEDAAEEVQFHTYSGEEDAAEEVQFHTYSGEEDAAEEVQFHTYSGEEDAAEEVQFHTYSGEEDAAEEVQFHTYSGDDAEPTPDVTGEAMDGDQLDAHDDAGLAEEAYPAAAAEYAPGEDAPYDAATHELPPYDDYEEPAPFTDDYTFQGEPTPQAVPAVSPAPSSAPDQVYHRGRGEDPNEDVHLVISDGVREIAGEVRNSLDFQRIQGGGEPVEGIVLSGPVLDVPGFASALERELGLPVYRGELVSPPQGVDPSLPSSRLAVAAGLSVEEVAL